MSRTKNAARNSLFGIFLKVYQIIIPFLMRTAMIYLMGIEYLGLNSLFTSILQVLSLAELGVGSAMIFSMYKPIADRNKKMICALLNLYKKYYFIIGLIICIIGCAITPLVPELIKDEIPGGLNIYILYLLNLAVTVMSYWLFAYKNALLQAHQRSDIASKVQIISCTLQYLTQLLALWLFHNYYLYIIVCLFTTALSNIITAFCANKLYPEYQASGKLPSETVKMINQRIRDLFTAKLCATIVNSADTVVISAFLGLTTLAMYQNYYFIMSSIMGIIAIVLNSCLASIGNSMVTEKIEKNYDDFCILTFLMNWIVTVCMGCFITVCQPFITIWAGKEYTFNLFFVSLMCIYFYLVTMQQVNGVYKDAAGVWHQDRFRPLIAALVNLAFNLCFVKMWGIYAIVLSTIVSYVFVAIPWMIYNVFRYVFHKNGKSFALSMMKYFIIACIISLCCYLVSLLTIHLSEFAQVIINLVISIFVSNALLIVIYKRSRLYGQMLNLIDRITKNRFSRIIDVFR